MAITTAEAFCELLEKSNLVAREQLAEARRSADGLADPRVVARDLIRRQWLTRWQAQQLLAGRHTLFLGKYKLLDKLGEGGMGTVFKAEQSNIGRTVALKVMAQEVCNKPEAVARFLREARAAAALNHPNIVTFYDSDCVGQRHFLVMEYVEGRDLNCWLKEFGRLPVDWACECIRQAALGLQHAHERGIIHRDIKPANLLVVSADASSLPLVKILDMGLARMLVPGESGQPELTQTGQVMGTPDYMAPEQGQSMKRVDIRADIYSLGCTLFKLLTAQVPFEGGTALDKLLTRCMSDAPRVATLRELPPRLDAIVAKMLAREPDARFQTPAEVADALALFALGTAGKGESSSFLKLASVTPSMTLGSGPDPALGEVQSLLASQAAPNSRLAPSSTQLATAGNVPSASAPSVQVASTTQLAPVVPDVPIVPAGANTQFGLRTVLSDTMLAEVDPLTSVGADPPIHRRMPKRAKQNALTDLWSTFGALPLMVRIGTGCGAAIMLLGLALLLMQSDSAPLTRGDARPLTQNPSPANSGTRDRNPAISPLVAPSTAAAPSPPTSLPSPTLPPLVASPTGNAPPAAIAPFSVDEARQFQQQWAAHLQVPAESPPNSIGMPMILIPPGEFRMGTADEVAEQLLRNARAPWDKWSQERVPYEHPEHRVTLSKPFYLGKYEVTQAEYEAIMESTPSQFASTGQGHVRVQGLDTARHPVERISWYDAVAFCNRLSEKEGLPSYYSGSNPDVRIAGGNGYRMPTEAEWEFACRAGSRTLWWFGDDVTELHEHAWYFNNGDMRTHPVGEKKPNPFGLYDIHGNIFEWCWDRATARYTPEDARDPQGPDDGDNLRALRGGRWGDPAQITRAGYRFTMSANVRLEFFGLRCARDAGR